MKILDTVPPALKNRGHPDSVPVYCDCGVSMMWERMKGNVVVCPSCHRVETLTVTETPANPGIDADGRT